jgi:hypothetical protein
MPFTWTLPVKRVLAEKNERRREALRGMRSEMRDETKGKK